MLFYGPILSYSIARVSSGSQESMTASHGSQANTASFTGKGDLLVSTGLLVGNGSTHFCASYFAGREVKAFMSGRVALHGL